MNVGDIAIGQNHKHYREHNGMEAEIIGELRIRRGMQPNGNIVEGLTYEVKWANGDKTVSDPKYLRKRPHRNTMTSWEEVKKITNWRPEHEHNTNHR